MHNGQGGFWYEEEEWQRVTPLNEKSLVFQGDDEEKPGILSSAPARTRTLDPLIKSQLLYRLSYKGRAVSADNTVFCSHGRYRIHLGDACKCKYYKMIDSGKPSRGKVRHFDGEAPPGQEKKQ